MILEGIIQADKAGGILYPHTNWAVGKRASGDAAGLIHQFFILSEEVYGDAITILDL